MSARYTVGSQPTYVAPGVVVMTRSASLEQLCALAAYDISVLGVIDALSNGDLRALPDFLVVMSEGVGVRVVARGAFQVAAGDWTCSGIGVATWTEQILEDLAGREVLVTADPIGVGPELPIVEGLVLAGSVIWRPTPVAIVVPEPVVPEPVVPEPVAPEAVVPEAVVPEAVVPEPVVPEPIVHVPEPEPVVREPVRTVPTQVPPVPGLPPVSDPNATRAESDDVFDAMFGATVHGRRPEDAAVREHDDPAPVIEAPPGAASPVLATPGDHDGRTITAAEMREQRRSAPTTRVPEQVATLRLTGGREVLVDRPVLLGRSPRSSQASSTALPTIVVVDDLYVSSTHLEVGFLDGTLVATDRSSNGTVLTRPGQAAERLIKDVATLVTDGCVLSLSDDFVATVSLGGA